MIALEEIIAAQRRIEKYIYHTPLEFSMKLSSGEKHIWLKLESQQRLKGFKLRGALAKLTALTEEERNCGVMACSSGNHGAGVSYAAHLMGGIPAKVFVPGTVPDAKLEKIRYYGAEAVKVGCCYDDAHRAAEEARRTSGMTFIDPCSDPVVIAGQGTIGLELIEDLPEVDTVLVPVGGGGMITGIASAVKALRPGVQVIGLQTAACPAFVQALKDNICYEEYPSDETICDSLVGGIGELPFAMAKACIDDIIVVEEEYIRQAVVHLLTEEKLVAEAGGAIGVGALLQDLAQIPGREIAVVISGGNIDGELLRRLLCEVDCHA